LRTGEPNYLQHKAYRRMKNGISADAACTKVFVISLRTAVERRRAFEADNVETRLNWTFFDAHETLHADLDYVEDNAIVAKGRPLTKGELGCYSSHYALWKKLVDDDDADQYIILEDDVIVNWAYLKLLMAEPHAHVGNNYIRLYYKKPVRQRLLQKDYLARSIWLVELTGYAFGTQAYLVTKRGARDFMAQLGSVNRPIDDAMDRSWAHGVPNRAVFPFPVIEQTGESNIGGTRFERFEIPRRLKVRRLVARNLERVRYYRAAYRFWRF
jgi:glycosyl transferase, family 25